MWLGELPVQLPGFPPHRPPGLTATGEPHTGIWFPAYLQPKPVIPSILEVMSGGHGLRRPSTAYTVPVNSLALAVGQIGVSPQGLL